MSSDSHFAAAQNHSVINLDPLGSLVSNPMKCV